MKRTEKNGKNVPFFRKERKRTERTERSFEKNGCPTLLDLYTPVRALVTEIKTRTGFVANKISEVSDLLKSVASREETPRDAMMISAIYAEISMAFGALHSLDNLSQLPKTVDDSVFFEALAEQTKISGIKTQKLLHCVQNLKKTALTRKIESLRDNYENNAKAIHNAERGAGKNL